MHCIKSVRIRSYSGPYFPAFGMNTERYGISFNAVMGGVDLVDQRTAAYHLKPILVQCHISITPENVRKPLVFRRFQGV